MIVETVHAVTGLLFLAAVALAYLFYRDFFAVDRPPRDWQAVYAGMGLFGIANIVRAVVIGYGSAIPVDGVLAMRIVGVIALVGALLTLIGCHRLWERFRL